MKRKVFILLCLFFFASMDASIFAQDSTYLIGPGDIVEISVWKDESLSRQLVVPPDGVVSFPLIGDVDVKSLTVTELRKVLKQRLSEYIPDPTVNVMLIGMDSLKAYVIGKVNNPGQFPITRNTTVMQVLSMAGGLNPFASETQIHILRQKGETTVKIPFNYKQVLNGENLDQNILLQRGDVIVVP